VARADGVRELLSNLPLPESIIGAIVVGLGLHHLTPVTVLPNSRALKRPGIGLMLAGGALVAWSTAHARDIRIAEPNRLLTRGPYAWSRNPMYVGWLGMATGLGLVLNSAWLLLTTSAAFGYLHSVEIPQEEAALAARFGAQYADYCATAPRYGRLPPCPTQPTKPPEIPTRPIPAGDHTALV
jgi:protein-S-isoprenylcysteine O-methyltransferase Ste14